MTNQKTHLPDPTPEQVEIMQQALYAICYGLGLAVTAVAPQAIADTGGGPGGRPSLSRKAAIDYVGCSGSHFDRYRREGELEVAWYSGRTPMFFRDDLDRLRDKHRS